jgi:hypothetical protein
MLPMIFMWMRKYPGIHSCPQPRSAIRQCSHRNILCRTICMRTKCPPAVSFPQFLHSVRAVFCLLALSLGFAQAKPNKWPGGLRPASPGQAGVPYQMRLTPNRSSLESIDMIGICSIMDCAASIRSNGSGCAAVNAPDMIACWIVTGRGMNPWPNTVCGNCRANCAAFGSFPNRYFVLISHALAALTKIWFAGSTMNCRAGALRVASPSTHQINVWYQADLALIPPRQLVHRPVMDQRTLGRSRIGL